MWTPKTVTSSATAKSLFSGFAQSISQTVTVLLADLRPDLHAVAQQAVDLAVGVVERLAAAQRRGLAQLEEHLADDLVAVALPLQPVGEQRLLDVAVALAVLPVAEVGVAERVAAGTRSRASGSGSRAGRRCSCRRLRFHQPYLAGEELLHHALLDHAGLVAAGFEGGDLGVHVGEDGGDGGLFRRALGTDSSTCDELVRFDSRRVAPRRKARMMLGDTAGRCSKRERRRRVDLRLCCRAESSLPAQLSSHSTSRTIHDLAAVSPIRRQA